jgi:hypothetical protein
MTTDDHRDDDDNGDNDDVVVARYRAQILAEADVPDADLDELDDHVRALAAELRGHGTPRAEAIALACRRVGNPRDLAREHARVRAAFGARPPRVRAWSAAALLAAPIAYYGHNSLRHGLFTFAALQLVLWIGVVIALAAQRTWARTLVLGTVAMSLAMHATRAVADAFVGRADGIVAEKLAALHAPAQLEMVAIWCAALAFVVPWRRGEIAPRGLALALLVPAYSAAMSTLISVGTAPASVLVIDPLGSLALTAVAIALVGVARNARWASLASFATALVLGALAIDAGGGLFSTAFDSTMIDIDFTTAATLGSLGSLGAAIVTRRARVGRLGTFRNARVG